jgi:hypothetical protein
LGGKTFGALSAGAGDALIQAFWPGSGDYWTAQEKGLTSSQVWKRAGVSALGGLAAFGIAESTVAGLVYFGVLGGPATTAAVVTGVIVFITVEAVIEWQKPNIFRGVNLKGTNER